METEVVTLAASQLPDEFYKRFKEVKAAKPDNRTFVISVTGLIFPYEQKRKFVQVPKPARQPGSFEEALSISDRRTNDLQRICTLSNNEIHLTHMPVSSRKFNTNSVHRFGQFLYFFFFSIYCSCPCIILNKIFLEYKYQLNSSVEPIFRKIYRGKLVTIALLFSLKLAFFRAPA